jgi:murein DD-endopeptidase MepM/ murein hydrolase activator NlpD
LFSLLKRLFSFRRGFHAKITVQDEEPGSAVSNHLNRLVLWLICAGGLLGVIIIVILLLKFTPLENLIFNYQKTRSSVLAIQHRVALLQDTINARNKQLQDMKKILLAGKDTVLAASEPERRTDDLESQEKKENNPEFGHTILARPLQLPSSAKLVENLFKQVPVFPAPYPIEGTLTRGFNLDTGHYGIDIAAKDGAAFKAIADGVIISEEWTFNYGYVIIIQHAHGIITVFKHAKTLRKSIGQIVRPGDVLGTIGNVGILSSGPHLHFEIWKNGIPQNAQRYLLSSDQD